MVERAELATMTADLVAAYVSNHSVSLTELPALIATISSSLKALEAPPPPPPPEKLTPAVPIKRSVQPDKIICLEDGRAFKSLRRHLQSCYGLTPDQYRTKWGLPKDYPMVAPEYAATRSALAKASGLGARRAPGSTPEVAPAAKSPRKKIGLKFPAADQG